MSAMLDSLAASFDGDGTRRVALDAALRDGLPGPRTESWKYTSLRALERRTFAHATEPVAIDPVLLAGIPAPRLVFVNGAFSNDLSDANGLPDGVKLLPLSQALAGDARESNFLERRFERSDEVFARLNAALAREGAVLRIAVDVRVRAPIHLVFIGASTGSDIACHLRNFVELRRDASATVIEHHLAQ